MTAFLARLDGLLIKSLNYLFGGPVTVSALIWVAETALTVGVWWEDLETRWNSRTDQRTPPLTPGRHRRVGRGGTWDRDLKARDDYQWGMAVKAMASRMEGRWAVWQ